VAGPERLGVRRLQRGAALLVLLAVLVLGASWFLVSRLDALSAGIFTASHRNHNALVLSQAKQALIGYVAMNAAQSGENNPGRFPCPEAAGNIGGVNEGIAAAACTLPAVGRLPWKTLGLDKLVDASSEPLWYVVSPGWAITAGNLVINSNTIGTLKVDGQQNAAVALIIAPGVAMNVPSAGCTARNQTRANPSPTIDALDYIECFDTTVTPPTFTTTGPTTSFNDQVVRISVADVMPAIEAAIAHRFQRDIAPLIRSTYSNSDPANPNPRWPANPLLPFALSFANPTAAASYAPGVTHGTQGILPLSYSETAPNSGTPCTPSAADPRCQPLFVAWTGGTLSGPSIKSPSCTVVTTVTTPVTTRLDCTFYYTCNPVCTPPTINYTIQAQAANVGTSLRQINMSATIGSANVSATLGNATGALDNSGSASLTLTGTATPNGLGGLFANLFCGLPLISPLGCKQSLISVPIGVLADHPILDPTNATYSWFLRNKWHEVSYYAVAPGIAPGGGGSCTTSISCLRVTYHPSDGKQRGLIFIAGRPLGSQVRPPTAVSDLLEGANAGGTSPFELRSATLQINRSFNDRIIVVDSNP